MLFDLDADGIVERVSWTAAGTSMVFLALDRSGNGVIDNGSELFGDHTPLQSGSVRNGFAALAEYDTNGDGVIDRDDTVWPSLLAWTDSNHDGASQPNEITPLSQTVVTAIELGYHWTGRRDISGNVFRYQGQIHIGREARPCYDVYFLAAS